MKLSNKTLLQAILLCGIIWISILISLVYTNYFKTLDTYIGKGDLLVYFFLLGSVLVTWYIHTLINTE